MDLEGGKSSFQLFSALVKNGEKAPRKKKQFIMNKNELSAPTHVTL